MVWLLLLLVAVLVASVVSAAAIVSVADVLLTCILFVRVCFQVVACVVTGKLKDHQLEKKLGDHARAVVVRRTLFERRIGRSMENLPVQVKHRKRPLFCATFNITWKRPISLERLAIYMET